MKTAIAIFAKTPGLSPVKTRLAVDIGVERAETFYRLSVKAVEAVLVEAQVRCRYPLDLYWALAEEDGKTQAIWSRFPVLWTGDGGLGERLDLIFHTLRKQYASVLMIGTDSPQLNPDIIDEAVARIRETPRKCVIGPSCDGGFYLFGASGDIPKDIWTSVVYSRWDTLIQLTRQLKKQDIDFGFLPLVRDVDRSSDLKPLLVELTHEWGKKLPAQHELANWLRLSI